MSEIGQSVHYIQQQIDLGEKLVDDSLNDMVSKSFPRLPYVGKKPLVIPLSLRCLRMKYFVCLSEKYVLTITWNLRPDYINKAGDCH